MGPAKTLWMKSYWNVKIYHFEFLPKRLSKLIFSARVKEFLCHKLVVLCKCFEELFTLWITVTWMWHMPKFSCYRNNKISCAIKMQPIKIVHTLEQTYIRIHKFYNVSPNWRASNLVYWLFSLDVNSRPMALYTNDAIKNFRQQRPKEPKQTNPFLQEWCCTDQLLILVTKTWKS